MIKAFAVDLDGTLLNKDGSLDQNACVFLNRLQSEGYTLIVATGRKLSEAQAIMKQLRLSEYGNAAILADGQYLYDYKDQETSVQPFLTFPEDYLEIIGGFTKKFRDVRLITAAQDYIVYSSVFCANFWKGAMKRLFKLRNPLKGVLIGSRKRVEKVEKIAIVPWNPLSECTDEKSFERYQTAFVHDKKRFEFKARGVNKCETLKKYLHRHKLSADSVAVFGNDENDLEMLRAFSNSYAVDTAPEHVKKCARKIIAYDNGNGVLLEMQNILEKG